LARQLIVFGRVVPVDELVAKIDAVAVTDVRRLAGAIFTETAPTLAAIGPVGSLIEYDRVAARLGAPAPA
jgi:predicted Zn-dependent peptidase